MNIAEQITNFSTKRAAGQTRMAAIMADAAADPGGARTLTADEQKEYDRLAAEADELGAHVSRLERLQKMDAQTAVTANQQRGIAPAIIKRDAAEKFQGQNFIRLTIARVLGAMEAKHPAAIALERGWHKTNPTLVELLTKANEIPSLGSGTGEYGAELVQADTRYTGDFIDYLYGKTLYNQLDLREVPANVMIKGQDGAAEAFWVGESKAIGTSIVDFLTVNLNRLKVATIVVMSNEWLQDSSPSGELLVRDSVVQAAAQKIDTTFFSNTSASAGVSPAGIFSGVTALPSSGFDADHVRDDVGRLLDVFVQAKNSQGLVFAMSASMATKLELMVNSLSSNREFPGVSAETGGTFVGKPNKVSDNVPADTLALLKPSDIYKIGDRGIRVELSRDATIQMSRAPTQEADANPPVATTGVSMFQTDSVALKIVQPINFQKRRSHAAQWITDAQYGETGTTTA